MEQAFQLDSSYFEGNKTQGMLFTGKLEGHNINNNSFH